MMEQSFDSDLFRWRLAETIAWCAHQVERGSNYPDYYTAQNMLRDLTLRPSSLEQAHPVDGNGAVQTKPASVIHAIVETLAAERAMLLRHYYRNLYPVEAATNLAGGRLFIYEPHQTLTDGASERATDSFLNMNGEPPWDSWLCYVSTPLVIDGETRDYGYLVSWVPPEFVERVDRGIDLNPEECIYWASSHPSRVQLLGTDLQ